MIQLMYQVIFRPPEMCSFTYQRMLLIIMEMMVRFEFTWIFKRLFCRSKYGKLTLILFWSPAKIAVQTLEIYIRNRPLAISTRLPSAQCPNTGEKALWR